MLDNKAIIVELTRIAKCDLGSAVRYVNVSTNITTHATIKGMANIASCKSRGIRRKLKKRLSLSGAIGRLICIKAQLINMRNKLMNKMSIVVSLLLLLKDFVWEVFMTVLYHKRVIEC